MDHRDRFSLEEIRRAFWARFHKSGEQWFTYFGSEADCESATNGFWAEFVEYLRAEPEEARDDAQESPH